ncbi:MAG: LytTR family transcriptional regulator DNA-binding domain-containing protein [Candidatus Rokubacteria bacterium]|nr:LytTR family transcriptional regulator DNA-binding domain-containing protein [Candidatus Rokubacteria bacterium]
MTAGARIRAYLVDDEPLALRRLARMLDATGRVEVVGRAGDPEKALAEMAAVAVDVVFLDIRMPGLSGFDVVERLSPETMVVFTTAYDRHAVQAFETNAVDYLLKPVEPARLDRTLDRVAQRRGEAATGVRSVIEELTRALRPPPFLDHLASRIGDRVQLIPVEQITHVVARDRATYAVTPAAEHMLDATIAELERRLDPARFLRIHRSALVNLGSIAELHAELGGRLLVRLKDDRRTELVVSRDRVRALKERLGLV